MIAADTADAMLVRELREQLQAMAEENAELRVQIGQRDRWITELRSTVAAFMGHEPFTKSGKLLEKRRAS
jgi:hypothetical protein